MTEEQFKEFAGRIASEDETRIALRNAFRWEGYSIVSDGRIALVVEKAFESLPVAEGGQESVARSLLNEILPLQSKDEWVPFDLDIDLLGRAAGRDTLQGHIRPSQGVHQTTKETKQMSRYPRTKDGMAKRRNNADVGRSKHRPGLQFNPANGEPNSARWAFAARAKGGDTP